MVSIPLAIACALVPWGACRARNAPLAAGVALAAAALAAGATLALPLYPVTNVPVLVFALAGGLLLGRALPARAFPLAVLLLVLGALDSIQLFVPGLPGDGGGGTPAPRWFYGMFALDVLGGWKAIGIFDLLLLTAVAEHWRRRGGSPALAALVGVSGFALAMLVELLALPGGGPLVPFILFGWLASELVYHQRERWRVASLVAAADQRRPVS